jgi:lipoate-protein ligase A
VPPAIRSIDPAELIARDAELLAAGGPGAHVYLLDRPSLILGVGQRDSDRLAARARAEGLTVLRRATGGTAVLGGRDDLAWSLVLPARDPRVGRDYVRAYGRLGRPLVDALQRWMPALGWGAPLGLSSELCLLGPRGSVLLAGDRVLGGAAQRFTARALLHHGLVRRARDAELTCRLFGLARDVVDRRLTGWSELGVTETPARIAEAIHAALDREVARSPGPPR